VNTLLPRTALAGVPCGCFLRLAAERVRGTSISAVTRDCQWMAALRVTAQHVRLCRFALVAKVDVKRRQPLESVSWTPLDQGLPSASLRTGRVKERRP